MRNLFTMLVVLGVSLSSVVEARVRPPQFKGEIYDLDGGKEIRYRFEHKLTTDGDKLIADNRYMTPSGEDLVVEHLEFKNEKLVIYEQSQKQTGGEGKIEVKGSKVIFTYKIDGKEKTSDENLKDNFVVGPTLIDYMINHLDQLKKGDTVDIRLGVIDRRETIGFSLKKDGEATIDGVKGVVIRMKPSSFIIAALVKPLYFTLAEDGSRNLELRGRLPMKNKVGDKLKDYDGRMLYKY